jgi:hypothetical protein
MRRMIVGARMRRVFTVVAAAGLVAVPTAPVAATTDTGSLERDPSSTYNHLSDVSVISGTDAWAVGSFSDGIDPDEGEVVKTLALHWDGGDWSRVWTPSPSARQNYLEAVVSLAPDDVWAVGSATIGPEGNPRTLVLHRDGTGWSRVWSPKPRGSAGATLTGVSAASPTDIWAVGHYWDVGRHTPGASRSTGMANDGPRYGPRIPDRAAAWKASCRYRPATRGQLERIRPRQGPRERWPSTGTEPDGRGCGRRGPAPPTSRC